MKEKNVKVLVKEINENFKEEIVKNELSTFQGIVEGLIDAPFLSEKLEKRAITIIINDEGKLNKLLPNILCYNNGELFDIVVGNICFVKCDDEGEFCSLTDDDVEFIKKTVTLSTEFFEFNSEPLPLIVGTLPY